MVVPIDTMLQQSYVAASNVTFQQQIETQSLNFIASYYTV